MMTVPRSGLVPFRTWRAGICCALALLDAGTGRAATQRVTDAAQISAAMKTAAPGDVLMMRNGTWTDQRIIFKGGGSPGRPITLRAETPGQVILNGSSQLKISGRHLLVDGLWFRDLTGKDDAIEFRTGSAAMATNCALVNCAFTGGSAARGGTETRWVSIYGTSNEVARCLLQGKQNRGATLVVWVDTNRPSSHHIHQNYFGPRAPLGVNGGETIRIGTSAESLFNARCLVESNCFERCSGEIEIISNKSCENVYRANTFIECEGALTFRHGNRCRAEGNFFLGNHRPNTGGIRVIGEDHVVVNNYFSSLTGQDARAALTLMNGIHGSRLNGYFQVRRALVAFNTWVDCTNNILIGLADGGGRAGPVDCTIANNLIQGGRSPLVRILTAPTNFGWEGNLFFGARVGVTNDGITVVHPLLVRATDGLWRPAATSSAINDAVGNYSTITTDLDGQPRPTTGRDIGADEVSTAPTTRRPLKPEEVGPGWWHASGKP